LAWKGAVMDYLSFSKKEWEVLVCFWAVDEPLCCTEFSERFGLNRNTSLSVIRFPSKICLPTIAASSTRQSVNHSLKSLASIAKNLSDQFVGSFLQS